MVVGSDITYEIRERGKSSSQMERIWTAPSSVCDTPVATPPPADAPGATKPNP